MSLNINVIMLYVVIIIVLRKNVIYFISYVWFLAQICFKYDARFYQNYKNSKTIQCVLPLCFLSLMLYSTLPSKYEYRFTRITSYEIFLTSSKLNCTRNRKTLFLSLKYGLFSLEIYRWICICFLCITFT